MAYEKTESYSEIMVFMKVGKLLNYIGFMAQKIDPEKGARLKKISESF